MLPKSFNLGPLIVHFYGVIIALSIYLGWYIAKKRASIYKIPGALFDDPILLLPLILAIFGARAYHVFDYWGYYINNPYSIINIPNGGLGIWGALVGIFIGLWIVARARHIDLLSILDLASPSLILGQAIGRIGNYINQEAFGPPTNLPWAVYIKPENRPADFINSARFHPTFFYEAILDFIFFLILIWLSKKLIAKSQLSVVRGQLFAMYLILYSTGRFITEFWRIDTAAVGGIKIAQVLSIAAFLIGLWLYNHPRKGLTLKS